MTTPLGSEGLNGSPGKGPQEPVIPVCGSGRAPFPSPETKLPLVSTLPFLASCADPPFPLDMLMPSPRLVCSLLSPGHPHGRGARCVCRFDPRLDACFYVSVLGEWEWDAAGCPRRAFMSHVSCVNQAWAPGLLVNRQSGLRAPTVRGRISEGDELTLDLVSVTHGPSWNN